jgi:PleD family two-component response regulator
MNGVEILEALRMNEATRKLPVIVFSNVFLGDLMEQAARAGATKCLSKSGCPPYRVIDEVQNALLRGHGAVAETLASKTLSAPPPAPKPMMSAPYRGAPAAAPVATPPPPLSNGGGAGEEVPENVRRELIEQINRRIEEVERTLPKWVTHAHNPDAPYLPALYRSIRSMAGSAGLVGCLRLGQMASVLEALFKDMKSTRASVTPSLLRTVSQAVELLPILARQTDTAHTDAFVVPLIVVTGSSADSYRGLCQGLEAARIRAIGLDDAYMAWKLFSTNRLDLVIVDIDGESTQGFELAGELRASESNHETPVVFVLDQENAEARVQASSVAGADFITKPVLPLELGVKALVHLQRTSLPALV